MWGFQLLGSSATATCGHAGIQLLMPQVHARLCQDCTLPWKWFGKSATCRLENSFRRCSNACLPPEVRESFLNSLGSTTSGAEFALARPGSFFLSPGLRWGPLMGTTWTLWWRRVCEAFRESRGSSGSYHPEPELSGLPGPAGQVLTNIRKDHEDGTLQKPVFLHIKTAPLVPSLGVFGSET